MQSNCSRTIASLCLLWSIVTGFDARAQSVADVFRNQTLRIVIPSAPGGDRVFYTLPFAEFYGRHIPGNPTVVPVFMPGAGGSLAINYTYNVAPHDGLTIVTPLVAAASSQAIGETSVKYDLTKMNWIGRTSDATRVIFVWDSVPARSVDDLRKTQIIIGSAGRASDTYTNPAVMNQVLGTKFKIVVGYKSAVDVNQAVETRETDAASTTWSDLSNNHADWLTNKKVRMLVQIALERNPELSDVPLLVDLASNEADRKTIEFMSSSSQMGQAFAAPPDVPAAVVGALRTAFDETMQDPDFRAVARKLNMRINPLSGVELAKVSNGIVGAPKDVVDRYMAAITAN
jgi:tripartite-type tricarboxylate transporter receptor subunit TctC